MGEYEADPIQGSKTEHDAIDLPNLGIPKWVTGGSKMAQGVCQVFFFRCLGLIPIKGAWVCVCGARVWNLFRAWAGA